MAPRTPSGACVCWASWGFASGWKWGYAAGQTHAGPLPSRYGVEIGSSSSITGPSIPARTREVLVSHLASYNMWALQGEWCFLWAWRVGMMGMVCRAQDHQSTWLVGETLSPGSWTGRLTPPRRLWLSPLQEPRSSPPDLALVMGVECSL